MRLTIPSTIMNLLLNFSFNFTKPSFENFVTLTVGAILTSSARTITGILRPLETLAPKHYSAYHRFLSRARWALLPLAYPLCRMIFALIPGTIALVVDDTLTRHNGPRVFGKACFLDPVRKVKKSRSFIYGHRWAVLSALLPLPLASRPWALPLLSFFCPTERYCQKHPFKHRSPWQLANLGIHILQRWFPKRSFKLVADGAYAAIEFTQACAQHRRIPFVSRLRMNACLYDPPTPITGRGRRPLRGPKQPSPNEIIEDSHIPWTQAVVPWYSGLEKTILYHTGEALLYKPKTGTVMVRWIVIKDPEGKNLPEAFFSTDLRQHPLSILQDFIHRWAIEVTFQEAKYHLALERTRNRLRSSVLRSVPLLLGLFSFISYWFHQHARKRSLQSTPWYQKTEATFSDALFQIRQQCWRENIFSTLDFKPKPNKKHHRFLLSLCYHLATAA